MQRTFFLESIYHWLHQRTYVRRLRNQKRFANCRVVSIGNLSAGGTGKTPAVGLLARTFAGCDPMVVLRGYGGSASASGALVSEGQGPLVEPSLSGDEAMLMAMVPDLRVAVGRDRASVLERFLLPQNRIVFLDDAFQNPLVYRDFELVLIDATVPLHRVRLFPRGRFREGLEALQRADCVLLTRTDQCASEDLDAWKTAIEDLASKKQTRLSVFESIHSFSGLDREVTGHQLGAFCGIGNPDAFFSMLESAGYSLQEKIAFPDHHPYSGRDLDRLRDSSVVDTWITTEKDAARLGGLSEDRFAVARIELKIQRGRQQEFLSMIRGDLEC